MQLLARVATSTLLLATIVPGIVATPVQESPNHANELQTRASLSLSNRQCISPAQINLANDPGVTLLGHCGWKMWVACTALAVGVCLIPCAEGALADPACDACLVGMGALGCKTCIQDQELSTWLNQYMAEIEPKVVASLQNQYCETPKPGPLPAIKLPDGVSPGVPGQTSTPFLK